MTADRVPPLGALALSEKRALSWHRDGTLRIWDLVTRHGRQLNGHTAPIIGALILREDCALSWSEDRTLRRWNLATGESDVLPGHEASIRGGILLPDDRLVTWSVDSSIRVRSVHSHDRALAFHFDATPTVVVPERTGRLVVGDALGRVHFLEIDDPSEAYASSSLNLSGD